MKLFKQLFSSSDDQAPPAPAPRTTTSTTKQSRLNPQLSTKIKNPSLIPGSFFERDTRFKAQGAEKTATHRPIVPPKTEGPVLYKEKKLKSFVPAYARLEHSSLVLYPPSTSPSPSPTRGRPIKTIPLVGLHLSTPPSPPKGPDDEFLLSEKENGAVPVIRIKVPCAADRDGWFVALGQVPGLFRRVEDYFVMGQTWGHGATSEVSEVVGRFTGKRLALKRRIHNTREATTAMHNELRILQMCAKHPHPAVPILEDFFFDTHGRIELVMQLMEGGELFDWIASREHLTEEDARGVFSQVVSGVAHLHSLGIAHRDLKPQNLMYDRISEDVSSAGATIKIMDYDLARVNYSPEWEGSTPCGTVHYMAPEVVRRQKYSLAVDCWSLGVILYILLCGSMPFHGKSDDVIEAAIAQGEYSLEGGPWREVSEEAKDMVRGLLNVDPVQRLTAAQCLEHPWLSPVVGSGSGGEEVGDEENEEKEKEKEEQGAKMAVMSSSFDRHNTPTKLKTIENLKMLKISNSIPLGMPTDYSMESVPSLSTAAAAAAAVEVVAASPPQHAHPHTFSHQLASSLPKQHPSPLSQALDYNLGPLRRQASELQVESERARSGGREKEGEHKGIANLRVTLDLTGTEAGIMDKRAYMEKTGNDGTTAFAYAAPSSPSFGASVAAEKEREEKKTRAKNLDMEFAALGASFVDEEEQQSDGEEDEEEGGRRRRWWRY